MLHSAAGGLQQTGKRVQLIRRKLSVAKVVVAVAEGFMNGDTLCVQSTNMATGSNAYLTFTLADNKRTCILAVFYIDTY